MQNIKTFLKMFGQLNALLPVKFKRKAGIIAVLSIVSAFVEMLGVSVMLPLVLAILQPDSLMKNDKVAMVVDFLGIKSVNGMVLMVSVCVIVAFLIKNIYIIWFCRYKSIYRNSIERDLSEEMFTKYIYKPYIYYLNNNTVSMERGVSSDVSAVASVAEAFIGLFNEFMVCLTIGIMLMIINPIMAISIVIIAALISILMIQLLRKKIGECGEKTRDAYIRRSKYAYEAFNGIKEIDVMHRQQRFLNRFKSAIDEAYGYNVTYTTISALPSRLTEMMFISGLIILVYIAYLMTDDSGMLIAQFGALGVAAIRVLPSITNISSNMNALVYNRAMLENAYNNIITESITENNYRYKTDDDERIQFSDKIVLKNVQWKYAENLPYVLTGVSMDIKKGEAVGIIGESGAGKTTLADIILGLYTPHCGTITVDGKDIFDPNTKWHKMVGYVPQNVFLIDASIRYNILFGIDDKEYDDERLREVINKSQLGKVIDGLENGMDTILGERGIRLSGGQKQRIAIARALYHNPDVLVLDEATSALDNDTEEAIMDAINELQGQVTLIIIAHRLSTIANCDKIYEVKEGKTVLRTKKEVLGD